MLEKDIICCVMANIFIIFKETIQIRLRKDKFP